MALADRNSPLFTWKCEVHSYEADVNGEASPETLCRFFQEAAWRHAENLHWGYADLQRQGRAWVLSRLLVDIERYPKWGEEITVVAWPKGALSLFALRDYEIYDRENTRIAAAASCWLLIDKNSRRPQRVETLLSGVELLKERYALEREPRKIAGTALEDIRMQCTVRYSDIDVNGHVNNSRYVAWLLDSYDIEFHSTHRLNRLEINFSEELICGSRICIAISGNPPVFSHSVFVESSKVEACRALLTWR